MSQLSHPPGVGCCSARKEQVKLGLSESRSLRWHSAVAGVISERRGGYRVDVDPATVRRRKAVKAAVQIAKAAGIHVTAPRILKDWNNTIIQLVPAPLVAKVGTSHFRDTALEALERELQVAQHLASKGAPIVGPSSDVSPGPHHRRGLTVTFWRFYEDVRPLPDHAAFFGRNLLIIHEALLDYPGELPSFTLELADAARLLSDRHRLRRLAEPDYQLLRGIHRKLASALSRLALDSRPLHGSPHSSNWLYTGADLLLLDFETACRGPVEWDLSAMWDHEIAVFPNVDPNFLALLRRVRSLCVAVKCWVEPDRSPEVREAADVHLRLLRGERLL